MVSIYPPFLIPYSQISIDLQYIIYATPNLIHYLTPASPCRLAIAYWSKLLDPIQINNCV
jgi:hypothetical protein